MSELITPTLSRRAWLRAALLLAAGTTLSGCSRLGSPTGEQDPAAVRLIAATANRTTSTVQEQRLAVTAAQDLTAALHSRLAGSAASAGTNPGYSPYSILMSLTMAAQGARGRTATELATALQTTDLPALARGLGGLATTLDRRNGTVATDDGTAEIILAVANSLWVQPDVAWEQPFLDTLAAELGAGLRAVNFVADSEAARAAINTWVSSATRSTIPELIAPGALAADTRMALVNALYLKAPWHTPFLVDATVPAPFTRADSRTVTANLMTATIAGAGYASGDGWQSVRLPYAGQALAMTLIRPESPTLTALEARLDGDLLRRFLATSPAAVRLGLPRWTSRTTVDPRPALESLGLRAAFTDDADFSGMTTQVPLQISAVLHQGYVAVDEAGTEASAATAVIMRVTGAPVQSHDVTFDRPYLYVIHDQETAVPLFLGRVDDPTVAP